MLPFSDVIGAGDTVFMRRFPLVRSSRRSFNLPRQARDKSIEWIQSLTA
jgi:hypothetical protein